MRKTFTSFLLLSMLSVSAATPKYFKVHKSDGSSQAHAISDIRKIVFGTGESGSLSIYSKNSSNVSNYPYHSLYCMTFEEEAGIGEVLSDATSLQVYYNSQSKTVEVTSTAKIEHVVVYDIQGRVVATISPASERVSMSLAEAMPGLYIVKAVTANSSITEKIVKQ